MRLNDVPGTKVCIQKKKKFTYIQTFVQNEQHLREVKLREWVAATVCVYGQKEKDIHFKFGCTKHTYTHFDFLHIQIFKRYKYK